MNVNLTKLSKLILAASLAAVAGALLGQWLLSMF